jgi:predicted dehydrogenase
VREGNEGLGPLAGDAVAAMFAFPGGLTGYFASRRSPDTSGTRWGLDLYGSGGIMAIRADMSPTVFLCSSPRWTGAPWTPLTLPGNPPPRDTNEANRALVADLLEAIEQNREPKASGVHARWTIEMAMAVYESQLTGGRVHFPLKNREHPLAR